jgi:ribonuclease J
VIPGNEKELLLLYNKFAEKDVEVVTEKNDFVHVSGHYCVQDLKKFYSYIKPKIAIAVHGEPVHLLEHQRVAKACGIKNVGKTKNGIILKITENKVEKIGQIWINSLVVDGKRILSTKSEILNVRKQLEEAGALFINLIINTKYKLVMNPVISAPGGYDLENDKATKEILIEDVIKGYNTGIRQINESKKNNKSKFLVDAEKENFLEMKVIRVVISLYEKDLGKKPLVEVFFTKVDIPSRTEG